MITVMWDADGEGLEFGRGYPDGGGDDVVTVTMWTTEEGMRMVTMPRVEFEAVVRMLGVGS